MQVPTPVKVIAVLYYVSAFLNALGGFLIAMLGIVLVLTATAALGSYGPKLVIGFGILTCAIGVFQFFLARGLWAAKNWARLVSVGISFLTIAIGITQLISSQNEFVFWMITMLFSAAVGLYLLLSEEVKVAFSA